MAGFYQGSAGWPAGQAGAQRSAQQGEQRWGGGRGTGGKQSARRDAAGWGGAGRGGGGTLYGWPAAPPSPTSDTEGEYEPWVLQLNRELPFSQLLPEAVPADAAGSWLVSSRFKPRAEEVLQGQKRALWRLELPGATVRDTSLLGPLPSGFPALIHEGGATPA